MQSFGLAQKIYSDCKTIFLGTQPLELVENYKYLGVDFEKRLLNFNSYHQATIKKVRARSASILAIGKDKDGLRAGTALTLFKAMVLPLIDYSAQVLHFSARLTASLEKEQMSFLKKALGVTTPQFAGVEYRHPNSAAIRRTAGIEPVECRVAKLKMRHLDRLKHKNDSILSPIFTERIPKNRGFKTDIAELHTKWGLDPENLAFEKASLKVDLAALKSQNRIALTKHYSEDSAKKYKANNILNQLDRVPRTQRGFFLQFLLGNNPLLRENECPHCKFAYDPNVAAISSLVHILVKCQHYQQLRLPLITKTANTLNTHCRALGAHNAGGVIMLAGS